MIKILSTKIDRKKLVSLQEAKSHLRINHNREDLYIDNLISVATIEVENYIDFPISIFSSKMEIITNGYQPTFLYNFYVGIDNIKGYDSNGVEIFGDYDLEQKSDKKLYVNSYPKGVTKITFDIETEGSPFVVIPETFKHAALIIIGDLYSNRQDFVVGKSSVNLKLVERLLNPYKKITLR